MDDQRSDDPYTDEDIANRRDAALRRALNTPPQPKHGKVKKSKVSSDAEVRKKRAAPKITES